MNKKQLAILLSKLKTFYKPVVKLEQYPTDSEIAADILWFSYFNKNVSDREIADLGCGTGILGLGALILDAKKVYFVDVNKDALKIAKENLSFLEKSLGKKFNAIFVNKDVTDFNRKVDTVIENPPFGVKVKHADKKFLEKAMSISDKIYSLHKIESKDFIQGLVKKKNFEVKGIIQFKLPLKQTLDFHKRKIHVIKVGCWWLKRKL
ncbi:DNA methylase [archaeon]|nr:DNA methylase [archaeon]